MNMFCYILGSGIMDKPYAVEIAISICMMVLFGYVVWYGFKRAASVRKEWFCWCVALCADVAVVAFLSTFYFCVKALRVNEKKQEPFEKVEYENHEYLIFKDREIFHNPNCPCRKMFNIKKNVHDYYLPSVLYR